MPMRHVAAVLLAVAFAQGPPQTDPGVWPPAGVYTRKDGATHPEILKRVEPVYAPEAIRARIQGFVTVQFVVEADGTVGPVRVTKPLDRALDAAAVDALKKWLFKPGMKDSVPARVLSTLVLTFSLGGLPPPMTLPTGFEAGADASTVWVQETVETPGVTMKFARPDGWERPDSPTLAIMAVDPVSMASVGVFRPAPLPGSIPFPMPLPQLARFSETMRLQLGRSGPAAEILSVGQATLGSANWLWLELDGSTANIPVPPEVIGVMNDLIDGVRLWAFFTSVESHLVQVMCSQPSLKGATVADREAALSRAQASCAGILKRIVFTAR